MEYHFLAGLVSLFSGVGRNVRMDIPLHQILTLVKNGHFAIEIHRLRQLRDQDVELYQKQKSRLLSFTPSGTFDRFRSTDRIKSMSGIMVLDFDFLDDVHNAKKQVIKSPYTLGCFISPSGQGLKVLVKTFSHPKATFRSSYESATRHYRRILSKGLDKADDVTRLCFVSHDPDLFWNPYSHEIKHKIRIYSYDPITKNLRSHY
ncbi:MAG: BT4734/BF3469 family protein [Ekhidna sp.]